MKKTSTWIWRGAALAGVLVLLLSGFYESILLDAGRFMAPVVDPVEQAADVIIMEGTEHFQKEIAARAISLLSEGKSKRLAVVLAQKTPDEKSSDSRDNPAVLKKELENMGLDESTCRVIITPSPLSRHPMTLTSAQVTMTVLAGEGVRSTILISPGFHMRRSYLVYQSLGEPLQMRIYPHASFDGHDHGLEMWWTQYEGVRDFAEQVLKLAYYLVRGYIPLNLSYGN